MAISIEGSARPLGVHSLDHFALTVPALETAQAFYSSFGLDVREERGGLVLRAYGDAHRWGQVLEGPHKRLHHLSFGAYAEDLPQLRARAEAMGVALLDPPAGFSGDGFWFADHDGNRVEIRVGPKVTPNAKSQVVFESAPPGQRGAPYRRHAAPVRPRRLSHVLLFTRSIDRAIDFYSRVLGLRLSDRAGDVVAFMHAVHGADHHTVAFAQSPVPGFHHCSWDVASVNEVGLGAMRMVDQGWREGWGFGRHVLGSNYFHYVQDPWGSYCEYSCDIDFIPAGIEWQAGGHPAEDALYLWGPDVPQAFVTNFEALDA